MQRIIMVALLFLMNPSTPILASNNDITYGGDGCPAGTAVIEQTKDGNISLTLSSFAIENLNLRIARKACNIAIPMSVPAGMSLKFGPVILEGEYDLGNNVESRVDVEAFFAGTTSVKISDVRSGPLAASFYREILPDFVWSPCGRDTILRLNTSILVDSAVAQAHPARFKIGRIVVGPPVFKKCG